MKIDNATTNNQSRSMLYFYELPEKEQVEFLEKGYSESDNYFKYKGLYYCLSEFMLIDSDYWDGVLGITNTSAIVVKIDKEDNDRVYIGLLL